MEEPIQLQPIQQVALVVKNLMANSGDIRNEAPSLGRENPLEKESATHSSILPWETPMGTGVWQVKVHGVTESDTTEVT